MEINSKCLVRVIYLWAADENGGMYWGDVEKKDQGTLDTKGRSHGKWKPAEGLGVGSDSRACLGDSDIAHWVQQQLEDELSVTTIFLVCPAVKGLTLLGTGTRQIVLDTKSFALLEYMAHKRPTLSLQSASEIETATSVP